MDFKSKKNVVGFIHQVLIDREQYYAIVSVNVPTRYQDITLYPLTIKITKEKYDFLEKNLKKGNRKVEGDLEISLNTKD